MPTVIVESLEGRTVEQKRGLVKDVTEAVMKNYNVPAEAVTVIIHEFPTHHLGKAGELRSDTRK